MVTKIKNFFLAMQLWFTDLWWSIKSWPRLHIPGFSLYYCLMNKAAMKPLHGPQVWPIWLLLSWSYQILDCVHRPSTGRRLWIYTRWGSVYWDFYIDRRHLRKK